MYSLNQGSYSDMEQILRKNTVYGVMVSKVFKRYTGIMISCKEPVQLTVPHAVGGPGHIVHHCMVTSLREGIVHTSWPCIIRGRGSVGTVQDIPTILLAYCTYNNHGKLATTHKGKVFHSLQYSAPSR
jgi:hypothetical protein